MLLVDSELEGELMPSGTFVQNGGVAKTFSVGAIVHLRNGQVLKFEENSSAVLSGDPTGEITISVLSGQISKWSTRGRTLSAGRGSVFVLGPSYEDPLEAESKLLAVGRNDGARPDDQSPQQSRGVSATRSRR